MDAHQRSVINRLKTARGQLNGVLSMVENDAYCPDVMKQLAAVQGLVDGASRLMLRRHLETCVAHAMQEGRTAEIVDELMETLKFDRHVFRPTTVTDAAVPEDPDLTGALRSVVQALEVDHVVASRGQGRGSPRFLA